ncbi:hypothetical protein FOZ62_028461, partial [Perkinsus olseni]
MTSERAGNSSAEEPERTTGISPEPSSDLRSQEAAREKLGQPPLDEDSLLLVFGSEEAHRAVEWCQSNCPRSDIFESRLEDGTKLKEEGNVMVKGGQWEDATGRYLAALYQVDFSIGQQWQLTNEHQHLLDTIKLSILNNLCLAYLHREDAERARKAADLALKSVTTIDRMAKETDGLQPVPRETLGKIYYRRAKAHYSLRDYDKAYADAKDAHEFCPSDTAVKRLMSEAQRLLKKEEEKSTRMWRSSAKKMFPESQQSVTTEGTVEKPSSDNA